MFAACEFTPLTSLNVKLCCGTSAPSSPPDWDWVGSVKGRSGDERSPQAEKLSVASFDTQTIFHKDGSNSWSKAEH